jgi:hypothetical protein
VFFIPRRPSILPPPLGMPLVQPAKPESSLFRKFSTVLEGKKVFWYQDIILIDSELLAARTFGFEKTKTFSLQV